jgi:hypothetical protein
LADFFKQKPQAEMKVSAQAWQQKKHHHHPALGTALLTTELRRTQAR